MADISKLAPIIFRWEGGYSNHPNDNGGATMCGVTLTTYKRYCAKKGRPDPSVEDLKKITRETCVDILRIFYWNPMRADSIANQSIANLCVDNLWGSGTGYIKTIQRVVGVVADGIVGPKTIAAINVADQQRLFNDLKMRRKQFYEGICKRNPSQRVFLRGWLNRLNDFKFEK